MLLALALLLPALAAHAEPMDDEPAPPPLEGSTPRHLRGLGLEVGGVVGLNRSILSPPEDPVGEPQFMSGSAFNGFGVAFGPTARLELLPFLALRLDLLFSLDRATGYEKLGERSRELGMSVWQLRVPIHILGGWCWDWLRVEGGLGPQLAVPLVVNATLDETNIPVEDSFPLAVRAGAAFGIEAALGAAFRVAEGVWLPTTLRLTWFPGIPSTSRERFVDYVSPQQPGWLQVQYDWSFLWELGVRFELL